MFSFAKGLWDALWGLLVEDGSLAVGIVVALTATWVAAQLAADSLQGVLGWLLLASLVLVVLANVQITGRNARRKTSE